jgi:hypothetical protein
MRFKQVLMLDLAKPFDEAAEAFMAIYDGPVPHVQDPVTVATLGAKNPIKQRAATARWASHNRLKATRGL